MELVIRSTGNSTTVELDGVEIEKLTMINFRAQVGSQAECMIEQIVTDDEGRVKLNKARNEVVRDVHWINIAEGEIV